MQFRLLGPIQVLGDGAPLSIGAPKQRALLACLLLRRGRFASREELIEALWGERLPQSAVGSLHVYVHGLRRVLGADRIESRGTAYSVRLEAGELDLERFEELIEYAQRSLPEGEAVRAASALEEALGLWEGPALGDLPAEMLATERGHLEELRLAALDLLVEAELALGQHERVIARLATLIAEHPYRERLREHQILALYRAGRQKESLEAYRQAREVLVEELGIEPGPRLRALENAILRQEPSLTPVASETDTERPPAVALPAPPTRLIGRRRELAEIETLFLKDGARLVTLTGPGGTGKTRLALAVAERLAGQLPGGGRFLDLSAVADPALLLPMIGAELGVPAGQSLVAAIAEQLRPRRFLLVLDNLERLLAEATALSDLLSAAPRLLILVTSRAPLHLRAEHEYPVPPLAPPATEARFDAIAANEAVELLTERARAVNRSCTLTEASAPAFAHICRRLDGLPLALELAASRMRSRSPEAVAAGLDRALELLVEGPRDLPSRQRTLRATLEWSYEQLSDAERRLFGQLAAFAGSFHADDVVSVCGVDARAQFAQLVEVNLVRQLEPGCFTMLQTIREYASEWLMRSGEADAIRARHCQHFLELAERAHEAILAGEDAVLAFEALEQTHDNLREALAWAADAGQVEDQVRLACALRQFWIVRGHLAEGRTFFDRAVAATEGMDRRIRAQALMHGGPFLYRQGELEQARAWWEEALTLLTEEGDAAGAARCAGELGAVAFSEGDLARSAELYARSAEGFAALGDRMRLGIVTSNRAEVAALQGDLDESIRHGEEGVAISRDVDDPDSLALGLHTLARVRQRTGDARQARRLFAECLSRAQSIGYREVIANCVQAAAELSLVDGGPAEQAARLVAVARQALEQIGVRSQGLEEQSFIRTEAELAAQLGYERLQSIEQHAPDVSLESVIEEALALLQLEPARPQRAARG
jgi:predicted ATPase/DNA-binding SARP family transcriptional activator